MLTSLRLLLMIWSNAFLKNILRFFVFKKGVLRHIAFVVNAKSKSEKNTEYYAIHFLLTWVLEFPNDKNLNKKCKR